MGGSVRACSGRPGRGGGAGVAGARSACSLGSSKGGLPSSTSHMTSYQIPATKPYSSKLLDWHPQPSTLPVTQPRSTQTHQATLSHRGRGRGHRGRRHRGLRGKRRGHARAGARQRGLRRHRGLQRGPGVAARTVREEGGVTRSAGVVKKIGDSKLAGGRTRWHPRTRFHATPDRVHLGILWWVKCT